MGDVAQRKMVVRVIAPTQENDVEIHELRPGERIAVAYMPPFVAPRSPDGADVFLALREATGEGAILVLPYGAKFEIVQVDEESEAP